MATIDAPSVDAVGVAETSRHTVPYGAAAPAALRRCASVLGRWGRRALDAASKVLRLAPASPLVGITAVILVGMLADPSPLGVVVAAVVGPLLVGGYFAWRLRSMEWPEADSHRAE